MDTWLLLLTALTGSIAVYRYLFKDLSLFKRHGILHVPPLPIVGNMGGVFLRRQTLADVALRSYNLHQDAKYVGFFDGMTPIVMIRDPELIESIAVKHFDAFPDHRAFIDEASDSLFDKNLFSLRGERWRNLRAVLTCVFTASKMRSMFELMVDCADNFSDFVRHLPEHERTLETREYFSRYANDVIASCAFGMSVDSLRNPDNEFYVHGKEMTTFNLARILRFYLIRSMPRLMKLLGVNFITNRVARFFKDVVRMTVITRDTKNMARPDILQHMMDTRGKCGPGKELTMHDMMSQSVAFFFGGFDTVSTLMCFAAHEIAAHPDVQARLRTEVDAVMRATNGALTYEALNEMQYLDAVISETLRLWPVAVFLDRVCARDFQLPAALPGGQPFLLKKGMNVWFPSYGLHRDPNYFDEPNLFQPERFLAENKKDVNPSAYLPFGIGPRMCIGNRFALMETKIVLFYLLARCQLKPSDKTSHPLKLCKRTLTMTAEGGFWLNVQPRDDASVIGDR